MRHHRNISTNSNVKIEPNPAPSCVPKKGKGEPMTIGGIA